MISALDPSRHSWIKAAETIAVMSALEATGGKARFVGGSVRNALMGEAVTDIDIATTLKPEDAIAALKRKGIAVVPTGIEHGTITAIIAGRPFEITSLRRDVATDGRRATVAFTDDWAEDAARRDFTMNAIYADLSGKLFDPTGGIADLNARLVRFVGDPDARIQEDYLRILRFFRFHAWYGKSELDGNALNAAERNKAGLKRLSGERIQKELLRLLEAPDPFSVLRAMQERKILGEILPDPIRIDRLEQLYILLREYALPCPPVLALAALVPNREAARGVASSLRLSNADKTRLTDALSEDAPLESHMPDGATRRVLYRYGRERFIDMLLIRWAAAPQMPGWRTILNAARDWTRPDFPIDGRDALDAGMPEGPGIGRALSAAERWWIEQDFAPDREALLVKLKELIR